jgi:hypothetical protein
MNGSVIVAKQDMDHDTHEMVVVHKWFRHCLVAKQDMDHDSCSVHNPIFLWC